MNVSCYAKHIICENSKYIEINIYTMCQKCVKTLTLIQEQGINSKIFENFIHKEICHIYDNILAFSP